MATTYFVNRYKQKTVGSQIHRIGMAALKSNLTFATSINCYYGWSIERARSARTI